jgi:hypothetical protein
MKRKSLLYLYSSSHFDDLGASIRCTCSIHIFRQYSSYYSKISFVKPQIYITNELYGEEFFRN